MSALLQSASSCLGPRLDLLGEAMIVRWRNPVHSRQLSDAQRSCWKVDTDFRRRIISSRGHSIDVPRSEERRVVVCVQWCTQVYTCLQVYTGF